MRKIVFVCFCIFLFSMPLYAQQYSNSDFILEYDGSVLFVEEKNDAVTLKSIDIPEPSEGHNTVLGCLKQENTEYSSDYSDQDISDFMAQFAKVMCYGLFDVDPGISVKSESAVHLDDGSSEYIIELSDGTFESVRLLNYGQTLYYAVLRICPYSADIVDAYKNAYYSIELTQAKGKNDDDQSAKIEELELIIMEKDVQISELNEINDKNEAKIEQLEEDLKEEKKKVEDLKKALQTETEQAETEKEKPKARVVPVRSDSSEPTVGQKNALERAKTYLDYSAFSKQGLIEQLEYEGYTHNDAVYAANRCGANWGEQAYKRAQTYLEYSAFSKDGLIDQLEFEGFTHSEAYYGATMAYK